MAVRLPGEYSDNHGNHSNQDNQANHDNRFSEMISHPVTSMGENTCTSKCKVLVTRTGMY